MYTKINKIMVWPLCIFILLFIAFTLNGEVLCIGNNGHIEIKSYCLPCCSELEDVCETDLSVSGAEKFTDADENHSGCSNCTDLELDGLTWSRLNPNIDTEYLSDISTDRIINSDNNFKLLQNNSLQIYAFCPTLGQGPPSVSIRSTVFLC